MSDIFQKYRLMQVLHSWPLIELGKRRMIRPMFWWNVTCLVGALAEQA
jgi:hypothetical protein